MTVPAYLKADRLGAILLARGYHSEDAMRICERVAIRVFDGHQAEVSAIEDELGFCPAQIRDELDHPASQKDAQ